MIGIICREAQDFDTVNNDDVLGGELVVQHLHERGYRNIAYLSLDLPLHKVERDDRCPARDAAIARR